MQSIKITFTILFLFSQCYANFEGANVNANDTLNLTVGKNLNLFTKTITFSNSTDSVYSSSNSFKAGTNVGFSPDVKDPQPKDDSTTKVNSTNLAFARLYI